ncbi:shewanella-like protein phosphatase 1 isoform X1 [Rhodamnia argentea]|uniref:Shewanella-like protein phosphatase 1 isoform X1 n=1 Tax=Rhodamnia argentea TaxID=178133 RepID=A0A8B8PRV4_9MYRT|nr:shewanella-like protein phosphatase 1 isoform X1 [Rhodamnia argentea]XP_030537507.1 shewanella-like protein phosphatase 1 isoform X1 [Rhodamnia argentea]XP_030537508.1 shewanella-like protein phosphatase 1 isoform X1 [Rhodamnia argentea]XP_048136043.1 shewanella-like protein phosphatase 1 isoform X1 [Rhodamnia argentea]
MASLCLNLLPSPHSRRLIEASSASSSSPSPPCSTTPKSSNSSGGIGSLKPVVINGNPPTFVSAPGRRIVAVGDLHGDLEQARRAFQMAGVLSSDGQDNWTGKETVLVQLGDILDRGENEIAILSLLRSMGKQAQEEGGAIFQINGNHETMNVGGDFRYVESGAFEECAGFLDYLDSYGYEWEEAFPGWVAASGRWRQDQKTSPNYWDSWNLVKRQKGVIARSVLLRPGGPLACELARHAVVLKVNDWVFCHGGLLPHHVAYGIERMNFEVSNWMRGLSESDVGPQLPFMATQGYDSVVWSRLYSRDVSDLEDYQIRQIQSILEETLQAVDAKAMVVGHTPQTAGVNCEYNCSIWRIDVGMSSGVLNSRPEVLEIVDGKARAVKGRRDMLSDLQVVDYT